MLNLFIQQAMLSEYTKLCAGHHADTLSLLLKCKMTGQLARMTPQLKEELEHIMGTEFPECQGRSSWHDISSQ